MVHPAGILRAGGARAPLRITKEASRRANPRVLARVEYKKNARHVRLAFFVVYPPGLEPGVDGVGGRNVIQLHYEYI